MPELGENAAEFVRIVDEASKLQAMASDPESGITPPILEAGMATAYAGLDVLLRQGAHAEFVEALEPQADPHEKKRAAFQRLIDNPPSALIDPVVVQEELDALGEPPVGYRVKEGYGAEAGEAALLYMGARGVVCALRGGYIEEPTRRGSVQAKPEPETAAGPAAAPASDHQGGEAAGTAEDLKPTVEIRLYKGSNSVIAINGENVPVARKSDSPKTTVQEEDYIEALRIAALKFLVEHHGEDKMFEPSTIWEAIDPAGNPYPSNLWYALIHPFLGSLRPWGMPLVKEHMPHSKSREYGIEPGFNVQISTVDQAPLYPAEAHSKLPGGRVVGGDTGTFINLMARASEANPLDVATLRAYGIQARTGSLVDRAMKMLAEDNGGWKLKAVLTGDQVVGYYIEKLPFIELSARDGCILGVYLLHRAPVFEHVGIAPIPSELAEQLAEEAKADEEKPTLKDLQQYRTTLHDTIVSYLAAGRKEELLRKVKGNPAMTQLLEYIDSAGKDPGGREQFGRAFDAVELPIQRERISDNRAAEVVETGSKYRFKDNGEEITVVFTPQRVPKPVDEAAPTLERKRGLPINQVFPQLDEIIATAIEGLERCGVTPDFGTVDKSTAFRHLGLLVKDLDRGIRDGDLEAGVHDRGYSYQEALETVVKGHIRGTSGEGGESWKKHKRALRRHIEAEIEKVRLRIEKAGQ